MKRAFLPVLSLFMVLSILVNTAGITVYNHFCLEEGESSISLTRIEKCCEDKKEKIVEDNHSCCKKNESFASKSKIQKKGCCSQDEFSAQWKLSEYSFQKNILIHSPVVSLPVFIPEFKLNLSEVNLSPVQFSPPLLFSPQEILYLHSTLLI